ncbi:hypothetical protein CANMA_001454 [Candida margitis]|uniref:uncharacterized protein n=1 Tax=Candida margitis TaxID=1775924 RepID=UPI0022262C5D|nr:uncharacterized protein CANMA_001454 [Candida margitis]KAI5969387.1 hypothetical protein CANMA_001454 [Candida margitis]
MSIQEPHIAVLVLDTPIPGVTAKYGDFGDNAIDLIKNTGTASSTFVKYQLNAENPEQLDKVYEELLSAVHRHLIEGYVLTGSRSDAFSSLPWLVRLKTFLKNTILKLDKPVVGLCFGHQVIASVLGCKIDRSNEGWEVGTTTISINDAIYKLENSPFTELNQKENIDESGQDFDAAVLFDRLNLIESHRDVVYGGLPADFINFGSTSKCSIQGMVSVDNGDGNKRNCKIITFQGHPEFTTDLALDLLKYKFDAGLLSENEYEKAKYHTSTLNNQGDLIGKVINKFLFEGSD